MSNQDVTKPLAVAGTVIAILIIVQPLSGTLGGISLNWIGAILVAIGGFLGSVS
jgi:hypothetical protein